MSGQSREFPRYAAEANVEMTAPTFTTSGRTSNVSRGGLAATVPRAMPPGENITVRLSLVFDEDTFSEPLDLPARVVWCTQLDDKYQLGIALLPLSSDQRTYFDMFLRYLEEGLAHSRAKRRGERDDADFFS
ncbi:PilZ domain-containing protein [Haliangium ochraceum]|uniref:Type IV pilus assembly PilZ n=1 Tax=Haliangium ochraceum (strain DSM 14365 / JCM 11303 / SMP-2) TaxID=502025 RepID=D0LTS9_HALO1|nr:PilZ domain-containing protein [Haliangium ochraceum]ACY15773.1 type IV pilus assembly PilZ [Haliangium ochraceum DSM 14365]